MEIRFRIRLWKISRDVARESFSFDPESRREGEEFSLREIFREEPDWGRHFSSALDKGDHMAAHGKKFAPSVQIPTLENLARCCLRNLLFRPVSYTHLTLPTSDLV